MKTVYYCDCCGEAFESWQKCDEHENSHVQPKYQRAEIPEGSYSRYVSVPEQVYPQIITLEMTDNAVVEYIFSRLVSAPAITEAANE